MNIQYTLGGGDETGNISDAGSDAETVSCVDISGTGGGDSDGTQNITEGEGTGSVTPTESDKSGKVPKTDEDGAGAVHTAEVDGADTITAYEESPADADGGGAIYVDGADASGTGCYSDF